MRSRHACAFALLLAVLPTGLLTACSSGPSSPKGLAGAVQTPPLAVGAAALPDVSSPARPDFPMRAPSGGLLLVYFGYTTCPDICPTTLSDLGRAIDGLPAADAKRVSVAFATIDPERDTPAVMTSYLRHFVTDGHALRSSDEATNTAVQSAFRITARRVFATDGSYSFDHTATTYVVDDQGRVVLEWPFGTDPKGIGADLQALLHRVGSAGTVSVTHAWSRSTAGAATTGVLYGTFTNRSGTVDAITDVTVPAAIAARAEMHATAKGSHQTMQMQPVVQITIPPHGVTVLKPGGFHVMLTGLVQPLATGSTFDITVRFTHSPPATVPVSVRA